MVRVGWLLTSVGCLSLFMAVGGCSRQESADELGTVVFEVPKVPGSNLPYTMPELGKSEERPAKPSAPQGVPPT